ncbi:MAG TPA: tyrosine-type recombinase/integrase [Ignavibacteriales bacterium]|nr:tyrosine-type recombinase/integrase [Ignavibacteriales bacterium]
MSNKGNGGIFPRGKVLYVRYYDPVQGKPVTESTKFPDSRQGWRDAKKYKDDKVLLLQKEKKSLKHSLRPVGSKNTLEDAFSHFLKMNTGKDQNTITEYNTFFYNYLAEAFPSSSPCSALTKASVEDFLLEVKARKDKSQNTKYGICKNMRKFLGFLFEYAYIKDVFMLNKDVFTRQEKKEVVVYSPEDIQKIMQGLAEKSPNFRVSIYLLAYSGLRPVDLFLLEPRRINIKNATMQFYSKKLQEWRSVPIHSELLPVIKERLETLPPGEKIVQYFEMKALGKAFRTYLSDLGLTGKGYTLRTFRKYFETEAYDNYGDARAIAYIAGHSAQTADKIYRQFRNERLKAELEKFSIPKEEKKDL